ncbi:MAG TPA: hypothetical protein VL500_05175 [Candidatus Eisenbacteria bacterium]|jgi:hypothetical protein|nr:hypothetical protein [Candidatus Eisenbacteria bacterium]
MIDASQQEVRRARFARLRAELSTLREACAGVQKRVAVAVKDAAKRRDDWLLEHTKKEHLG